MSPSKALPEFLNTGLSFDGSRSDRDALMQKDQRGGELERGIRQSMGKTDKLYNCWDNDRSWTISTPVSDGKYVYVALYGGNKGIGGNVVACFDLEGKSIWRSFTGQTNIGEHGTHATPVLSRRKPALHDRLDAVLLREGDRKKSSGI